MAINSPNFTQIPNEILDDWIGILSKVEFKIIMMICRKTFGWKKDKDKISLSQFVSTTKAGKQCIIDAIKQLESYDLIEVNRQDNKTSEYQMKVVSFQDQIVSPRDQSSPKTGQEVVSLRDTQKKVKETKQKKKKEGAFVPPVLNDINQYIKENKLNVDGEFFLKYFTEGNWIDSKGHKVKNWKQKLITWDKHSKDKPEQQKANWERD